MFSPDRLLRHSKIPPTGTRRRISARHGALARRHGRRDLRERALDEELVQRIDARGTGQWSGTCTRYTGAHRDPLSGEGARRFGGRWNPPLLFSAIYLTDSTQACMVEVETRCAGGINDPGELLEASYRLHTIAVTDLAVLDLTTLESPRSSGFWKMTTSMATTGRPAKTVGHAAWFLHVQGVLQCRSRRSRPGHYRVRTTHPPGQLQVSHSEDLDTRPLPRTAAPLILRAFQAVPTVRAVASSIACSVAIRSEPADRLPPGGEVRS